MHLLIATSSYPLRADDAFAAAGLFVRDFALEIARCGHRVTVLTHARPGSAVADAGVAVVRHPAPGISRALARLRPWHPLDGIRTIRLVAEGRRAMRRLADRGDVDHVLAMWAFPAGLHALDAHRRCGVPYSVWTLGSDIWSLAKIPYFRQTIRRVLRGAQHTFADGLALGRATEELSGRACAFLPSARTACEGEPRAAEWSRPGFQFVFIGRLENNKGPDILVEAAALLRRRTSDFAVSIFGDGTLRDRVRERIECHGLGEHVSLRGFAPPDVAHAHLRACDAAVIPSRIESIPVVFSDALRAGAPLIVTDVGDMGELVRRHEVGLVARPRDPADLALAMESALRTPVASWRANALALAPAFSVAAAADSFLSAIDTAGTARAGAA